LKAHLIALKEDKIAFSVEVKSIFIGRVPVEVAE
jgi:hypothetical protein